ncbi:uncharacterized protein LOC116519769 isoform X2 [Thamnophis elegans]|uniref:uncharacterized protein LOC116519769 isoform X2 n=1 Tax=Thamnophis elegans TaxID=35005 RepID=UPI0013780A2A|nr:uncharacterized protein LOC116519769 isoform X2 [Thamnophis elegans]
MHINWLQERETLTAGLIGGGGLRWKLIKERSNLKLRETFLDCENNESLERLPPEDTHAPSLGDFENRLDSYLSEIVLGLLLKQRVGLEDLQGPFQLLLFCCPSDSTVDLNPGDLIEIFRTGYQHWAVYVGLGNVVHLAPPSECAGAGAASCKSLLADRALVKKEPLLDVVGGDRYCVSNKHDNKYSVRTPDQIVCLANDLEGKTMEYKVTSQNCLECGQDSNCSSFDFCGCPNKGLMRMK